MWRFVAISAFLAVCAVSASPLTPITTTEPAPPPRPYAFGYAAGRFPGNIDRTHSEVSDGSGVVKGSFSYVDPKFKIRTVNYVADKEGFHPILNEQPPTLPADTPVVAHAKDRHLQQYSAIASAHQQGAGNINAVRPQETRAVQRATAKHFGLYQQIAEEHARIAHERQIEEELNPMPIYTQH